MAKQKGAFAAFIIRLAITATALCVAIMIATLAILSGFRYAVAEKVFAFMGMGGKPLDAAQLYDGGFRLAEDGQHRLVRMPLLDEAVSFTMSGAAAVARQLAELAAGRLGTLMLFHFPSIWLHVLGDHLINAARKVEPVPVQGL